MKFPVLVIGLPLALALCSSLHADETIESFDSRIQVHPDSSLTVQETIVAWVEGRQIRHGIRRDFPVLYTDRLGVQTRVPFHVTEVLQDGTRQQFHLGSGQNLETVYIGRRDQMVSSGRHTYQLTYQTRRQLGFFPDHDELYWNVTGNDWAFPIQKAQATVLLPSGASILDTSAYTGPRGAQGKDFGVTRGSSGDVRFETSRSLAPGEGLTISVSWPKGFVHPPTGREQVRRLLEDNRDLSTALGGFALLLAYYLLIWFVAGRDPAKGVIYPQFSPPSGISPPAARFIWRMAYDNKVLTAALLDAAVKGMIRIKEEGGVYSIISTARSQGGLYPGEVKALELMLGDQDQVVLQDTQHAQIQKGIRALKRALASGYERVFFNTHRSFFLLGLLISAAVCLLHAYSLRGDIHSAYLVVFLAMWLTFWSAGTAGLLGAMLAAWASVWGGSTLLFEKWGLKTNYSNRAFSSLSALGWTVIAIPFLAAEIFALVVLVKMTSLGTALLAASLGVLNILFYYLLKAPTRLGRKFLDQLEGFRMYLNTAEKDELNFKTPPQKTPQLFEAFLPYAIALGVENAWAQKFEGILRAASASPQSGYSPGWYSGTTHSWSNLGPTAFSSSLSSAFSSAVSSASTAPGSSSGGGGGGSSGGGGGGGGGGGW